MHSAEVRRDDGSPALYIDDVKTVPILYGLSDIPGSASNTAQAQRNIRAFADQGISYVTADTDLRLGWHKQSPFEVEPMQEEIAGVLAANPNAGVILRLHLNPPYWWMRDYPEENVVYLDQPGIDNGETQRLIRDDHMRHMRVSLASRRWLDEAGALLKQFCQTIWDTPEGRAIVGIQAACGVNGEWHQWGTDCSAPMRERFQRLLREKYGTDAALQSAWGDPEVKLGSARFVPDTRRPGDDGVFRDPIKARDTMDAQYCIQLSVVEAILHFCRIIKENWGRPVLAGAFYGYYLGTGGSDAVIAGHLLTGKLYEQRGCVDFLCGPMPYMQNREPDCVPMSRGLLESNRLHGLLWLTEMDQHPAGTENIIGGDPARLRETIAQLRRNVLLPVTAGMGLWYYDHRLIPRFVGPDSKNPYAGSLFRKTGWWESPALMEEIGRLQRIAEKYALRPYRPAADVLLVYDPEAHFAQAEFVEEEYALQEAVSRAGAAYDCVYLQDLDIADMPRYRCVVFANASRLRAEQRDKIHRLTADKQVVWLYAAGFSNDESLSEANIRAAAGIAVRRLLPEEMDGGRKLQPQFAVIDPEAEPLCCDRYAAARKGNTWYFTTPRVSVEHMRMILKRAGAHIYCESGDPVLAGAGLAAINSFTGGRRELLLRNGKKIVCDLPPLTTAVFDGESGEALLL